MAVLFASISRSEWVELWAGALGAIPAAVISASAAAWVAVTVLNRSNAHQQGLAAEAVERQKELAERQLSEQRTEAARARELNALADVIFAAEGVALAAVDSEEALRGHVPVLQSAMARWRIELGRSPMQQEVMKWSVVLLRSAHGRVAAEGDAREETEERLHEAVAQLTAVALAWPTAGSDSRAELRARLAKTRLELSRSFPGGSASSE